MSRIVAMIVVAGVMGAVAGCRSQTTAGSMDESRRSGLEELGQALKVVAAEGRKPPAKMSELEAIEPLMAVAGPQIRNGDLVYLWGAPFVAGGTQVVAYEKGADTGGGYVLFQDGTVKKLSATEFQSAPKAK